MERGEKRARKRSRKASETEQAAEESPPPPMKTRKRSNAEKLTQPEEKPTRGTARTRKKGLKVSFDIVEHNLSVGDSASRTGGSECTVTLGNKVERTPPKDAENSENCPLQGTGAGPNDRGGGVKKRVDIKFKKSDFTVSTVLLQYVRDYCLPLQFSYLTGNKKRSWKSFKQIITAERGLTWQPSDPTCKYLSPSPPPLLTPLTVCSLDAPPPLKPAKKYADISGFIVSGLLHDH